MSLYTVFANDGENSFQENFLLPDRADPREAGIRHLAAAWKVDLKDYASLEAYADEMEEFEVGPATADSIMMTLMDAVRDHLENPSDADGISALRLTYAEAVGHRSRYMPA